MSRMQRIRIVAGLVMGFVGVAIAYVGPLLVYFAVTSALSQRSDFVDEFDRQASAIQTIAKASYALGIAGLATSLIGFLYAFVQWAIAFIGPPDRAVTSPPRA
jgi:hypothetical protein